MRVSVLSYKMPELPGQKTGFFAPIPHHGPEEGKRYFETTYYASYQKKFDEIGFKPKSNSEYMMEGGFSGAGCDWMPKDRKRITTKIISEKYNMGPEPKYNTEVQRAWTYIRDPAVRAVQDYGIDNTKWTPLPKIDSKLSLGLQSDKHYESQRSKSYYGCPKKFTDVTKTTFHVVDLRKY
ncbi:MAG: hypothetical protein MJ252_13700 [archaeon]|nr:hypothetical protein [archaeon]